MAPLVIAHRGDSDVCPENTLAAFRSALDLGVELVEFDVQLTRDGAVVVLHDPTLERTTTGQGPVGAATLETVRALSAGYAARFGSRFADERVPTLAETLALLRGRAGAMIEIKPESVSDDEKEGIEARTLEEVRQAGMEARCAVISFSRRALLRCRALAPEIPRGHLFHEGAPGEMVRGAAEAGAEIVLPHVSLLSPALRDLTREAGIKLATWVVDDPAALPALQPFDLYGIGTNRPGALMRALAGA